MRLVAARLHAYRLSLRTPIETAHERLGERLGLLLELESDDGVRGFGDACPIAGFGLEDLARCDEVLARFAAALPGCAADREHTALLARLDVVAPDARAARGALDSAILDLAARRDGVSFAERLAGDGPDTSRCSALPVATLVTGDDLSALVASARSAAARGFETFKLKLGVRPLRDDLARVAALREALGPAARLRVDANGAWSEPIATAALAGLSGLAVELIEQPVAAANLDAMARLCALGLVPIAADEAATSLESLERLLAARAADIIVLKPGALGGASRGLELARLARSRGCEVFVTSLLDSALGLAAAVQLASCLSGPRPADGLATSALFERDLAAGPCIEEGRLRVPTGPGLGVSPDASALAELERAPLREWTT